MTRLRLLLACLAGVAVLAAVPFAVHDITTASGSRSAATSPDVLPAEAGGRFTLLQMNLCLSGLAACLRYPEVVGEAVAVIRARRPDAVTLNEVCERDVARIAGRTGYHRRFITVPYQGRPLPCSNPAGRGVFGNAVLTRGAVTRSADGRYAAQDVLEERRWLCVTAERVTVCATHLEAPVSLATVAIRHRQCAELADMLAARARRGPTVAAGDINGLGSCAPPGMWTRTDLRVTAQKPGLQHVYGDAAHLRSPVAGVVGARSTDHDFLLVTARVVRPPGR